MNQEHTTSELARIRLHVLVAIGELVGRSANEVERGVAPDSLAVRSNHVGDRGLTNGEVRRPQCSETACVPERQMATRRMANHRQATVGPTLRRSVVDRGGDIGCRRIPAASARADPPILDVPDAIARARQVVAQRVHEVESVLLAPEAAVNQHDQR